MSSGPFTLLPLLIAASAFAESDLAADLQRASQRLAPRVTPAHDEVDRLTKEAAERLRAGDIDRAVGLLDRAAGTAFASGATGRAFELSLTAAEAMRSRGRLAEAAGRFRDAALGNPRDPRAAIAHQAACEAFALTLDGADDARLDAYDALLRQNVSGWPEAAFAREARWRRLRLLQRRRRWGELRDRLATVEPVEARAEEKSRLLIAAQAGLMGADPTAPTFDAARRDLEPLVLDGPGRWPAEWTPVRRAAALALARGATALGSDGVAYARRLLRVAWSGPPAAAVEWRQDAASLLAIVALTGGDPARAAEWIAHVDGGPRAERDRLLEASRRRLEAGATPPVEADRLARSLTVLNGDPSDDPAARAAALADAGRQAEALDAYERLAAERPNDRSTQVELARLRESTDPTRANEDWRAIEARTPRGSSDWFEARAGRLRALIAGGRRDEAEKLWRLTRLLAPTLGGPRHSATYRAIEATLRDTE